MNHPRAMCVVAILIAVLAVAGTLVAQEKPAPAGTVILDTRGFWRMYPVMKPPVIRTATKLKKALAVGKGYQNQPWMSEETPEPPKGWEVPDFDDSRWMRGTARAGCNTEFLARQCLRGKFRVTSPAKVRRLTLTLSYYGGAIVYFNGTEIARGHLAPGEAGRNGLAEIYPPDAYYSGSMNSRIYYGKGKCKEVEKRLTRTLQNVVIPSRLLRRGVNVVAIELVRPPEQESVQIENFVKKGHKFTPFKFNFPLCALRTVQLVAAGPLGVVPNAVRPKGFQVWNSNTMAPDFTMDFGDNTEALTPMKIVGARNGSFSGKVVVGHDQALHQLKATMSDLGGPGVIPASAVRVRYGVPWSTASKNDNFRLRWEYCAYPSFLGALEESPPREIPVRIHDTTRMYYTYDFRTPNQPTPVPGAVASIWVTVDVPKGAPSGDYRGRLTIRARNVAPVEVPVHLTVEPWVLPDTQDYNTWIGMIQSPDTLVLEYGVEPWSDEHFKLIAESMKQMGRSGCRLLYIPVICRTNIGNEESMVRWIKKGEYEYDWDFSVMDRYLDTAVAQMGPPKVVCFWVWDTFLFPTTEDPRTYEQYRVKDYGRKRQARTKAGPGQYVGRGPQVTVLDPATGKTESRFLPYLLEAKSKAIWKRLFDRLRRKMKERGLLDAMMLGTGSDIVMRKDHFAFYKEVAPGLKWVNHSHFDVSSIYEANDTELGYYSTVMNIWLPGYDPESLKYGWKRKALHTHLCSRWGRHNYPLTVSRLMAEINIAGNQRGVARLGADMWALKGKRGRYEGGAGVASRYPESSWRSNNICQALFAPGTDGPIATVRYQMMCEGVQECEARIFIEKTLTDEKRSSRLGADLAARCREALDERLRYMIRGLSNYKLDTYFSGNTRNGSDTWWRCDFFVYGHVWHTWSGWETRTQKLYRLAGEVAKK